MNQATDRPQAMYMPPWMLRKVFAVPMLHIINLIVFLGFQGLGPFDEHFFFLHFTVSAEKLQHGYYWTLLTSALAHYSLLHYLINSMVLQSFGPIIERYLGMRRFLVFFVGAALISSVSHALTSQFIMGRADLPALGVSGVLCGLMLIFGVLFPKSKILFMGLLPVPALFGVLLFVGIDLFGLFAQSQGGGFPIGHGAHLGGSLAGALYFLFFLRGRKRSPYR